MVSSKPAAGAGGGDVAARLTDLEARVARLEADTATGEHPNNTAGSARADRPDHSLGYDPEVFWALEGLRTRSPTPEGAVLMTGTVGLPGGGRAEWQEVLPTEALLKADWSLSAGALAALGHPIRLLLLRHVLQGVRTTAELAGIEELGTTGQLYHHLRQLVAAGWLRTTGRGQYEVSPAKVVPLLVIVGGTQP